MSDYATCPHCDCDLFVDDYYDNDNESYRGGEAIACWTGHCPECGKNFKWKEVYLFDRIEELVEVE